MGIRGAALSTAAGLASALFFACLPDAAAVLALGTAGPGYFPAFMDPAGRVPIPAGPAPGFFFGLLALQAALFAAHRFRLTRSWRATLQALGPAPGALLPLVLAPWLPLYADRMMLVACLALYAALAIVPFARPLRALIVFARRQTPALVSIVLGVMTLVQIYLIFSEHDYGAFVAANELAGKYKRNLLAGGLLLILLSTGATLALLWRRTRKQRTAQPGEQERSDNRSASAVVRLLRKLRSPFAGRAGAAEEVAFGKGPALALLAIEAVAGTLVLYSFFALPQSFAGLFRDPQVPALATALLIVALIFRALVWRYGLTRAAAAGRWLLWATPLLVLNIPFFEYRHEILSVGLVTVMSFLIAREYSGRPWLAPWSRPIAQRAGTIAIVLLILLGLGFVVWLGLGAVNRFHAFLPLNLDLSVEHQALWTLSHHGYPFLSIGAKDGIYDRIYWPDHVPFFYYALAPLYRLAPRVETLLWLQTLFLAAGALPVFLLARRLTASRVAGATAGALYLLHPGFQLLSQWDVHEGAFAVPLFLFALYFYESGRPRLFLLLLALGGSVREEMGLFGVSVGLMLLLSRRDLRYGTYALLLGAAQFVIMSKVMQTYFGGLGHYERYYPLFFLDGQYSVQNILYLLLFNPLFFLREWWAIEKLTFVLITLLPLGFLPLLGLLRWRWTILLAGLASTLLAVRTPNYTPGYQYSILLLVGCFYLLPQGLRLLSRGMDAAGRTRLLLTLLLLGLSSSYLYGTLFGKTRAISFMGEWNPDRGQIEWNGWIARSFHAPRPTPAQEKLRALLKEIPARAPVAAPERISTHLSGRARNYTLPRVDDAEYVVIHRLFESDPSFDEMLLNDNFAVWKKSDDGHSMILKRK